MALTDGSEYASTGSPQHRTLLSAYGANRPPWNVAGVDYYVGAPQGLAVKDPATIHITGVTVNSSRKTVTITGNNITLDGYDFSLNGGWGVVVQGSNTSIRNSNFVVGSNGNAPILATTSAQNITIAYSTIDGGSNANVGGLIEMRGSGTVTVKYSWLKNAGSDMIQMHTGGRAATAIIENNLLENAGMAPGAHGDYTEFIDGPYSATIRFNTTMQNGGTTQGFMVEPDIGSTEGRIVAGEIGYNIFTAQSGGLNVYTGVTVADIVNTFTVHNNYFDPNGTLLGLAVGGNIRGGPNDTSPASIYSRNVNMRTGAVLEDRNAPVLPLPTPGIPTPIPLERRGDAGNDTLFGGAGNDTLFGEAGDDRLDGKGGADIMTGGVGNDIFLVDDAGDQVIEAVGGGTDNVYASVSWAMAAGQEIEFLRAYGAGATLGVILLGNGLNNYLIGGSGVDMLNGGAGDDRLNGGGGVDVMTGGAGNDIYYVDNAGDQVIEAAGGGADRVYASVSWTMAAGQEIEFLRASGAGATSGVTLGGNELNNYLIGGSGNDVLNGGAGDDRLNGGGGVDVMTGGAGNDIYYVDNAGDKAIEAVGGGSDNVYASVSWAMAAGQEIETLRAYGSGATSGITLTGNGLNNYLIGGAGADVLNGGAGDDRLNGRGGADTMTGGAGNDIYYVDNAGDKAIEAVGGGSDNVYASVSWAMAAGQEIETLRAYGAGATSGVALTGNDFNNTLVGGPGNDVLNGGLGNDMLVGGAGNDTFRFYSALGPTNIDRITDFSPTDDIIELNHAVFTGLVSGLLSVSAFSLDSANGSAPQIVYNHTTGALFYDGNGSAAGGSTQFATIMGAPSLTNSSFRVV